MPQVELESARRVPPTFLPLVNSSTFASGASWGVIVLMSVACIVDAIRPTILYPGNDRSSLPTDLVQSVGVPLLLASVVMTRRRSLLWLLLWPGTLLYLLYHDVAYVFSMQLNPLFVLHLVLAALNLYATMGLVSAIDADEVRRVLAAAVHEKLGGYVLAFFGILVAIAALAGIMSPLYTRTVSTPDLALHVTDFLISPTWIIGGVLLLRRKPFGYVAGLGLLFQASMLFVGLVLLFVLQTVIFKTPFRTVDTLVVITLGTVCFVPCSLFARGVLLRSRGIGN